MSDGLILATLFFLGLAIVMIFYIFGSFTYEIREHSVCMKWELLKYIPFKSVKIDIDDILEARRYSFEKDIAGADYFGNLLIKPGVILVLKRRRLTFSFIKRIYITPDNPDEFIARVNQKIQERYHS
ncbi:MAG: hypothetical protein IBX64_13795 [Actinobacteria bacterium]|nr:hypothetical protein [Actinomycetota bacterium]